MKKAILIILLLAGVCVMVKGQVPTVKTSDIANAGKLLSQFTNAIKPSSFNSNWTGEKSSFLSNAAKITDAAGLAQSISSLAGFLKPGMFKSGFNLQSILDGAKSVASMGQAAGLLKNLEGGLKPEAMSSGWNKQRSGWLNALNLLK